MATTWIVAADSSRARILQVADREQHLVEIADLLNPEGRAANRDLVTDEPGRRRPPHAATKALAGGSPGLGPQQGNDPQETTPTRHMTELFVKKVAEYLDKARTLNQFDELYLIAPPKFLGLLRAELSKELEKRVRDTLSKDLSWLNVRELEAYLKGAPGTVPGSARAR
jgi:protein required for attachment to host cells